MNKQISRGDYHSIAQKRNRWHKKSIIQVVGSIIMLALFIAVSSTLAQSSAITLAGGDVLEVTCTGAELLLESLSPTQQKLTCVPQEPPPPTGSFTFTPSDDSKVRSDRPDRIHGSEDSLRLRHGDPAYNSYLKFDVNGLNGPVQSAKLRLFVTDGSREGGVAHLVSNHYKGTNIPWSENGLNWSNAPALEGAPLGSVGAVSAQEWIEFDVTAAIAGDGQYSFGLTTSSSDSVYYSAKEAGANNPTLVIEIGDGSPEPTPPSPEVTATPTGEPPPTPEPQPTPINTSNSFGVYPDCIAPAIGVETHSWWQQPGEHAARHVHLGTCAPNARDLTGQLVSYEGDSITLLTRIVAFNNPGRLYRVRADIWKDNPDYSDCPGGITCVSLPDLTCGANPSSGWDFVHEVAPGFNECHEWVELSIPLDRISGGLKEFRLSPFVRQSDLPDSPLQFATSNFQIYLTGGSNNYRRYTDPESRSWYEKGFTYANARWAGYMDLFESLNETMPTLSGVVTINVAHSECDASSRSLGYIDPAFHPAHTGHSAEPAPFYEKSGCFRGSVQLDTTQLSNGIHSLYLQTREESDVGMNAGAGKYFFRVQN